MSKKEEPITLATLAAAWKFHKKNQENAEKQRLLVEAEILEFLRKNGPELPDKETTTFKDEGIKITTGITTTWDQEILAKLAAKWPEKGPPWPFMSEYKPDNAQIKYLRENVKAIWDRLKEACSEKEKKPSFQEK